MPKLCKNGLHELDPDNPYRSADGTRCRECKTAKNRRGNARYLATERGQEMRRLQGRERIASGRGALAGARYYAKPETRARKIASVKEYQKKSPRYQASRRSYLRYGLPLSSWEDIGLLPRDLQGVLSGNS